MPSNQPWHQLCKIRDDVRTGSLTLDEFAANLHVVRTGLRTMRQKLSAL